MGNPSALRDPVALAVGGLAVHRLTRLLVDDEVTRPLRERLAPDDDSRLAYFLTCPWCVSIHVAAGWVALSLFAPRVARVVGTALAWSAVTGLVSEWA